MTFTKFKGAASKTILLCGALASTNMAAHATAYTWAGGTGNWDNTTAQAWTTAGYAGSAQTATGGNVTPTDSVTFNGTGSTSATVNWGSSSNGRYVSGITITGGETGTTTIVQASGASSVRNLYLGSGGISIASGAGAFTIGTATTNLGVNAELNASQTWTNNSGSTFTLNNAVQTAQTSSTPTTLTIAGSGNTTFSSNSSISDSGTTGGTTALIFGSTGTTTISGSNTYSGGTTINSGIVTAYNSSVASTSVTPTNLGTGTVAANGGTLLLGSTVSTTPTTYIYANNFSMNGGTVEANAGAVFLGVTAGTGTLSVGSTGGTLGSLFTSSNGSNREGLWVYSAVSGSGPLSVQYLGTDTSTTDGAGSLVRFESANTYTGTVTVVGGNNNAGVGLTGTTLLLDNANALANAVVNLNGDNASGGAFSSRINNSTFAVLNGIGTENIGGLSGNGDITLEVVGGTAAGYVLKVGGGSINPTTTYSGSISDGSNAGGSLIKAGTGTLTLTGANTFTGSLTASAGTLQIGNGIAGSVSTSANVSISSAGTLALDLATGTFTNAIADSGTLSLISPNTTTVSGVVSGTGGNVVVNGTGTTTLSNANSYSGITTITAGTLVANNVTSLGNSTATLALNGGVLDLQAVPTNKYNTTVGGATAIQSDNTASAAGVVDTLGTLSIGANTLSIAKGANATGTTAGVTFGATTLTGASTFSIGSGTTLTLGAVTNGANTGTITGAGNFAQTGVWGNGAGGITFDASFTGTATLNQTNTYTGATSISNGTVIAANASALGADTGSAALVLNGGVLDLQFIPATAYNTTVGGNATIQSDRSASLAGNIDTLGNLSIGTNTLTIAKGANATGTTAGVTFGGTTTLNGNATFSIGAGTTLTLGTVVNGTNNGDITGAGNFAQTGQWATASGAGGLTFDSGFTGTATLNQNNTYAGGTTVNGGVVNLSVGGSSGAIRGTLNIGSGGRVNTTTTDALGYGAGTSVTTVNINGGTLNNSASTVSPSSGNNGFLATFNLTGGTVSSTGGGAINFSDGTAINSLASSTTSLFSAPVDVRAVLGGNLGINTAQGTTASGIDLNISGIINDNQGGLGGITKTGNGTLELSGANAYTGGTILSTGTIVAANASALGTSASALQLNGGTLDLQTLTTAYATTVGGNATILSDKSASGAGATYTLGTLSIGTNTLTIGAGSNVASGTAGVTFGATTITGNANFTVNNPSVGSTLLTLGALSSASANTITLAGNGKVTLGSAAGTIASGTTLVVGTSDTLNLNNATALGSGVTNLTDNGTAVLGANTNLLSLSGTGSVTTAGFSTTLNTATAANYGGALGGSGNLIMNGSGTQTLSGTNTGYSGGTTINSGALVYSGTAAMSSTSAVTLASGATLGLRSNTSGTFTSSGNILTSGNTTIGIDVNNVSSGTNQTLTLGGGLFFAANTTDVVNVTGGNGYTANLGAVTTNSAGGSGTSLTINATTAAASIASLLTNSFGTNLILSGGNNISLGQVQLNSNGTDTVTISGANVTWATATVATGGRGGGGFGAVLNSGTLNLNIGSAIANPSSGTATLTINGGTLDNTSGSAVTTSGMTTTIANSFTFAGTNNLTTGSTSLSGNSTITVAANTLTLGSTNIGANTLTKAGSGTLTLGGLTLSGGNVTNTSSTGAFNTGGVTFTGTGSTITAGAGAITMGIITNSSGGTGDITVGTANSSNITSSGSNGSGITGSGGNGTIVSPFLTVNSGADFASINASGQIVARNAFSAEAALPQSSTTATQVYFLTGSQSLTGSEVISALRINDTGTSDTLALGVNALSIGAGTSGILYNGGPTGNYTITGVGGGTVGAQGSSNHSFSVNTYAGTLTISALLTNTGTNPFTKGGVGTLVMTGSNSVNAPITIGGGVLDLGNGTTGAWTGTGSASVQSGATLGFGLANTGTFSGAISNSGNLNGNESTGVTNTLSGGILGSGNITQTGAGTTILSGTGINGTTSFFTGAVNINAGALGLANAGALGATTSSHMTSGVTVASGAALQIDNISTTGAYALTINGSGVTGAANGALEGFTGTNVYTGAITLGSNAAIGSDAGATLNASGAINTGTFGLTVSGAGATTLSGTVNDGSSVAVTASGNTSLSGVLTGAGGLTISGSGTTTMNGSTSNGYTGQTVVSSGELDLAMTAGAAVLGAGVNDVVNSPDISVTGGTLKFLINDQMANSVDKNGSVTLSLSSGAVNLNGTTQILNAFRNSGGTFTTGAGGDLIGTGASITFAGGTNTISATSTVEDNHYVISGGTNTVQGGSTGGILQLDGLGTGIIFSNGANLTLNSDSTSAGQLVFKSNIGGVYNINSTAASTTASITSGGSATNAGVIRLNGQTAKIDTAQGTVANGGPDLLISASIVSTGTGKLTKLDAGTLALSGTNTYSGATTISGGTLDFVNAASFYGSAGGSVSATNVAKTSVASGATMALGVGSGTTYFTANDVTTVLGHTASFASGSNIGFDTTNAGGNFTYSPAITDAGSNILGVVKIGTGTLTLSSTSGNSYSGGTTIKNGSVLVTNTSGSGTGTGAVSVTGSGSTLGGTGVVSSAITLSSGGSLYSGAVSSGTPATGTGTGMTLSSALNVNGGNLTFALSAGNSTATVDNPNTTTSYFTTTGSVNFTGTDSITLVDLTNGALSLRMGVPYLLISAGSNSAFSGLVTESSTGLALDGNGEVLGVWQGGLLTNYVPISIAQFGADGVTPLTTFGGKDASYISPELFLENGNLEVVPEPGTWALMLSGLGVLVLWQRRRKSKD